MKLFEISRNDKCLCGSNIKYKYCCMDKISEENYSITATNKAINNKDYEEAYIFCNADLTKYLIGIKRHTELLLKSNPRCGNPLLEIDLNALEEILNNLGYIMYYGNIAVNIDDKFSRIESLFENKKLLELIRFYRVLLISIIDKNSDRVKELLKDFNYNKIEKIELLEIYYENIACEFEYSNKIKFLSKLINKEPDGINKIKFNMILALNYNTNGEMQSGIKVANNILDLIKNYKALNEYELYIMAGTYFYCGLILEDNSYFKSSIDTYNEILPKVQEIEGMEISDLYNEIGEVYLMDGKFTKAIEAFNSSLENNFNHLAHINIARAKFELGKIIDATKEIYDFSIDSIPEDNLLDYLIIMGRILVINEDKDKAKEIYDTLKILDIEEKLFRDYRNKIIINLLEQYRGFYEDTKSSSLSNAIEEINQSFELKPNFMGIGINFNHIISMFTKKK